MSDPVIHETTIKAIIDHQPKPRADAVVVTPDTFESYVKEKLNPGAVSDAVVEVVETPEAKAEKELKAVEAEKAARLEKEKKGKKGDAKAEVNADEEIDHPDKTKKQKLNERFSEITAARKAAETKATEAAAKVEAERTAREAAERDVAALRAKYEPPKSDEIGPEPQENQFVSRDDWLKALKEHTAEVVRREDAKKAADEQQRHEKERINKEWTERETEIRKEIPDYDEVVNASTVRVSDQLRDAILESEIGPKLRHHLATNPEVAENLAKMTVGRMLKEVGKIEATLMGKVSPPALKVVPKVEVSKAPEPISPLKGGGDSVLRLSGHDEVPKNWTYEDWKAARNKGQIK